SKAHRIRLYEHLRKYKKIIRNLYFVYFKKIERISTKTNKDNAFNNTFIISNFSIKRNIFV
ncbi:hypothetical protein, partial [Enterococcus faecalis]|uniref:hypothetical protein n=1 Tax=Enterococcus faecalis TaxID=1351 RepID=UPI003D6C662B